MLHTCKSAKPVYRVSEAQPTSITRDCVECGLPVASGMDAVVDDLGPTEPKYRCKKQKEHISVTEQEM